MHWWYKDIFIDRHYQSELEHQSNLRRIKMRSIMKVLESIKQPIVGFLQHQKIKLVMKQSARAMSNLTDAQLLDVGLTREHLYMMSKGQQPARYTENLDVELKPKTLELVSVNNQSSQNDQPTAEGSYQKAA